MKCDKINCLARKKGTRVAHKLLWDKRWDCLAWKRGTVTHSLLVMGLNVMRLSDRKKGTVTHSLLVTWWNAIMAMQKKGTQSLTYCWPWYEIWWDCQGKRALRLSLTLYWSWDVMRWDFMADKQGNSTCILFVIWWVEYGRKMTMSLTSCWSWDENALKNWQCHLLAVHHFNQDTCQKRQCYSLAVHHGDQNTLQEKYSVTYRLGMMKLGFTNLICISCHSPTATYDIRFR